MTTQIFIEFLRWFDKKMTGRKVALLMDNFSAPQAAIADILASQTPLQNTLIIWLPANSTSRYQPLDQRNHQLLESTLEALLDQIYLI